MGGCAVAIHTRLTVLAAFSALPFAAMAQDSAPPRPSAAECEVMAQAGEAKLRWREKSPDMPMSPGSYGEDCDWKALGIKDFTIPPPDPGPYFQGVRFSFSRPVFSADGGRATVDYTIGGSSGPRSYFYRGFKCIVKKAGGRWKLSSCPMSFIT
jgi:hypothetical protein